MKPTSIARHTGRVALALASMLWLAACAGQTPAPSIPTQPPMSTQPVLTQPPAPTASAPVPAATSTSSAQAQPAPTQSSAPAPTAPSLPPTPPLTVPTQPPAPPACKSPAALTPAQTEGPYFKAGSPDRASLLEPGMDGTKLILTGYVFTTDCRPIAHALLEFWQADAAGQYDNAGYRLRGHQFADAAGRYELTTIVPGLYPGRTEHIHFKVQAPGGPVLTSQLYFPGVANNQRDSIFDERLLLPVQDAGDGLTAAFDFVVSGP